MTSNVELLPLPAEFGHPSLHALGIVAENYARANVEHHTAAKDAEIEALRADLARVRRLAAEDSTHLAEQRRQAEDRAERLAEALLELTAKWREPQAGDDCTLYTMGKRDGRNACAAELANLHPTAAQEGSHDVAK